MLVATFGPDLVSIPFSTLVIALLSPLLSITQYRSFRSLALPRIPALDRFVVRLATELGGRGTVLT